jgi:IS30 family transposase
LTPEEEQKIKDLRSLGLTGYEIAEQIGRSKSAVYEKLRLNCIPNWTEWEKQKVVGMRAKGKSYREISKKIKRSEKAVMIFMCRYRKAVKSDPKKQEALRLLTFTLKHTKDPGIAIHAIRKSKLYGRNEDVLQL